MALTERVETQLAEWTDRVVEFARDLHAHPETSFAEHRSAERVAAMLEAGGYTVERGVGELPTAFSATIGTGELTVGVVIEYDALPGVGHACGHNLIAGSSVLAALALAPLAEELGITIRALGTPAEEHGGGKTLLLERGVFDGIHLAIMMHPMADGFSHDPAGTTAQAVGRYRAVFHGQAAHAAAAPFKGRNAADAAVLSQVAIGLLRQQIPGDHRVAAIVRDGGDVTNIIPERTEVEFECRAFTLPEYRRLFERVRRCFEGAALATETDVDIQVAEPLYEPLVQDDRLARLWADAMGELGYDTTPGAGPAGGSTDMGNISQVIPSLHPWVSLPGVAAGIHSREFADAANTDAAYRLMADASRAMALTIARTAADPERRTTFLTQPHHTQPVPAA